MSLDIKTVKAFMDYDLIHRKTGLYETNPRLYWIGYREYLRSETGLWDNTLVGDVSPEEHLNALRKKDKDVYAVIESWVL